MGTDHFGETIPTEVAKQEMDYYIAQGGNIIDTAHLYGQKDAGLPSSSEECIGSWLKERGNRENVFLVTKGCCPPMNRFHEHRTDEKSMKIDISQSMDSLGTPVDIWFFHRDNPAIPAGELLDMANSLIVEKGYAHAIGASNWTVKRIQEANDWAQKNGKHGFVMSEIQDSLAHCTPELWGDDTLVCMNGDEYAWYRKHHFPVLAFASQAKGYFSKLLDGEIMKAKNLGRFDTKGNRALVGKVKELSQELSVSPAAIALAYLTSQEAVIVPIIGSSRISQIEDSLSSSDLVLTEAQIGTLTSVEQTV